jgi:hypothetical protein
MSRILISLLFVLATASTSACKHTVEAKALPSVDLGAQRTFGVRRLAADNRGIDRLLVEELRRWNRSARALADTESLTDAEVLVTYQDRWMWDLTMYMLSLDVQLRDPETEEILASGQVTRTSVIRKSPEHMVHEVLTSIFSEACPAETPPVLESGRPQMRSYE